MRCRGAAMGCELRRSVQGHGFSMRDGGEIICDLGPVVDPDEPGGAEVMGCGEKQALAFKAEEVARQVVNEVVGTENGLVAAKNVMCRRNEREMPLQPTILWAKGVGHNHGLGGNEDFKAAGEVVEHFLRAGDEGKILEEIFGIEKGAELFLAVKRRVLPDAFAGKIVNCNGFVEGLVVAAEVLGEGVCHDFVHVDADALHESSGRVAREQALKGARISPDSDSKRSRARLGE